MNWRTSSTSIFRIARSKRDRLGLQKDLMCILFSIFFCFFVFLEISGWATAHPTQALDSSLCICIPHLIEDFYSLVQFHMGTQSLQKIMCLQTSFLKLHVLKIMKMVS